MKGICRRAAQLFRRVTQMEPQFAEGHFNLGLVLLRQGDTLGAEKNLVLLSN